MCLQACKAVACVKAGYKQRDDTGDTDFDLVNEKVVKTNEDVIVPAMLVNKAITMAGLRIIRPHNSLV